MSTAEREINYKLGGLIGVLQKEVAINSYFTATWQPAVGLFVIPAQISLLFMQICYTKDISLFQPENEEHSQQFELWEVIKILQCSMS